MCRLQINDRCIYTFPIFFLYFNFPATVSVAIIDPTHRWTCWRLNAIHRNMTYPSMKNNGHHGNITTRSHVTIYIPCCPENIHNWQQNMTLLEQPSKCKEMISNQNIAIVVRWMYFSLVYNIQKEKLWKFLRIASECPSMNGSLEYPTMTKIISERSYKFKQRLNKFLFPFAGMWQTVKRSDFDFVLCLTVFLRRNCYVSYN